jgi:hypothetical protein
MKMQSKSYSVFEYLYRDAANYKAWGQLLLTGQFTDEQVSQMLSHFDSGEFFIAEQIGIPTLYEDLWQYSNGPTSDDHSWHSFHAIRPATSQDIASNRPWGTVEKLLSNLQSVSRETKAVCGAIPNSNK